MWKLWRDMSIFCSAVSQMFLHRNIYMLISLHTWYRDMYKILLILIRRLDSLRDSYTGEENFFIWWNRYVPCSLDSQPFYALQE